MTQFCTYTTIDHDTKDIVSMVQVDKRETELKSTNMEKLGLKKTLVEVQEAGLTLSELVTDAHVQIASMMGRYNKRLSKHLLHVPIIL